MKEFRFEVPANVCFSVRAKNGALARARARRFALLLARHGLRIDTSSVSSHRDEMYAFDAAVSTSQVSEPNCIAVQDVQVRSHFQAGGKVA